MNLGVCRGCGKEAVVDEARGLGPVCLKKYGLLQPDIKKNRSAVPVKFNNRDLSKVKNTYDLHSQVEEAPLDLATHNALEKAGYDDFNREGQEEIFNTTIKTLFNGDRIPADFKDKLNSIGFEVKGFLPRMRCTPGNFINLIVGVKDGKMDMLLRVNINYDTGLLFFRTNPQYALLNPDETDLFISMRDEVYGDSAEGASDFNYFMSKIDKNPHSEYINNFPEWVLENCNSNDASEKKNVYSYANITACKFRGNSKIKKHASELSAGDLRDSAFMSPEQQGSPLRDSIIKSVAGNHGDLSNLDILIRAVDEVNVYTYDIYSTKLGRIMGHLSSGAALGETLHELEKSIPESDDNNAYTRTLALAIDLCKAKGYNQDKTRKIIVALNKKMSEE